MIANDLSMLIVDTVFGRGFCGHNRFPIEIVDDMQKINQIESRNSGQIFVPFWPLLAERLGKPGLFMSGYQPGRPCFRKLDFGSTDDRIRANQERLLISNDFEISIVSPELSSELSPGIINNRNRFGDSR